MKNDDHENGLTPEERAALDSLPGELAPPAELEDRVASALHRRGLLRHEGEATGGWAHWLVPVAVASVASLLIGIGLGFWLGTRPAPAVPLGQQQARFLLLLRTPAASFNRDVPPERLRKEYAAWGQGLAQRGIFLAGEELDEGGRLVRPAAVTTGRLAEARGAVAGYFLIRASGYDDAVAIARDCPHLNYGGDIEVRALVNER